MENKCIPPNNGWIDQRAVVSANDNRNVIGVFIAETNIKNRKTVVLENLTASLYGTDQTQTDVKAGDVTYNFSTKVAKTTGTAQVSDPRFSAKGNGVIFSTATNKGFLHGPVVTTVSAKLFNEKKDEKK